MRTDAGYLVLAVAVVLIAVGIWRLAASRRSDLDHSFRHEFDPDDHRKR
jgi:uncharacterized membrane protein YqjE